MNRNRSRTKVWKPALACLAVAALGWPQAAPAAATAKTVEEGRPVYPGAVKCPYELPPHRDWTKAEEWAWGSMICLGEIADMSKFERGDKFGCDPEKADDWPETRDLTPAFLETILNHEPYRGALPRIGIHIRCARFNEILDLSNTVLERRLSLGASRFRRVVFLTDLRSSSPISLSRSVFDGPLHADRLDVAGSLFMRGGARFKEVRLVGAKVDGNLETDGSTFADLFDANRLEVAGSLYLRGGASFKDVRLNGAVIAGHLQLWDSDFDGHLDLTSVSIGEELQLNSPRREPPRWTKTSGFTLRNARVGALNDTDDAWDVQPGRLDLIGFTYERLGGLEATKDSAMSARSTEWLREWLAKQDGFETAYNPQPFEQLARVLRESGYPGKADAILFAARDHQRDSPVTPWWTKAKLWVLWGLIGYGYHNWIAVLWFAGLTGLGVAVCRVWAIGLDMRYAQRFWYSFDMALPLIVLNKRHEAVKLTGGILVYFYFHKLAGFVLASFLVAGLSGLTK